MLDFILIAALSIIFGVYVSMNYWIVAGLGLLTGFFFGGFTFFLKILPVAFMSFVIPLIYAVASSNSLGILNILFVAGALTAGYTVGSLLAIVFFPVKLIGKITGFFLRLIGH